RSIDGSTAPALRCAARTPAYRDDAARGWRPPQAWTKHPPRRPASKSGMGGPTTLAAPAYVGPRAAAGLVLAAAAFGARPTGWLVGAEVEHRAPAALPASWLALRWPS